MVPLSQAGQVKKRRASQGLLLQHATSTAAQMLGTRRHRWVRGREGCETDTYGDTHTNTDAHTNTQTQTHKRTNTQTYTRNRLVFVACCCRVFGGTGSMNEARRMSHANVSFPSILSPSSGPSPSGSRLTTPKHRTLTAAVVVVVVVVVALLVDTCVCACVCMCIWGGEEEGALCWTLYHR